MRGLQEIEAIFETWPEGFKNSFGRPITQMELEKFLRDLKDRKIQKSLDAQFGSFVPVEIELMLEYLKENEVPFIENGKQKHKVK